MHIQQETDQYKYIYLRSIIKASRIYKRFLKTTSFTVFRTLNVRNRNIFVWWQWWSTIPLNKINSPLMLTHGTQQRPLHTTWKSSPVICEIVVFCNIWYNKKHSFLLICYPLWSTVRLSVLYPDKGEYSHLFATQRRTEQLCGFESWESSSMPIKLVDENPTSGGQ
jgi:hypothetical protein